MNGNFNRDVHCKTRNQYASPPRQHSTSRPCNPVGDFDEILCG